MSTWTKLWSRCCARRCVGGPLARRRRGMRPRTQLCRMWQFTLFGALFQWRRSSEFDDYVGCRIWRRTQITTCRYLLPSLARRHSRGTRQSWEGGFLRRRTHGRGFGSQMCSFCATIWKRAEYCRATWREICSTCFGEARRRTTYSSGWMWASYARVSYKTVFLRRSSTLEMRDRKTSVRRQMMAKQRSGRVRLRRALRLLLRGTASSST